MRSGDNILLSKLDEFIRRYYRNMLLRGSIYATAVLLAAMLAVVLLEYFGEFGSAVRAMLFFGFLSATAFVVAKYIVVPLLKLNRIGAVISYEQAAVIVGDHFSSVQDKLLNVLQLQERHGMSASDELLVASVNQKISELRPVPFAAAVDLGENRRHLRYVLPLLAISTAIAIIWPQVYRKSATRLVHYDTYFEKEMPFAFHVGGDLEALQAGDYRLEVKVTGNTLPNEVFIRVNNIDYRLEKDDKTRFHYTFSNLQSTVEFQLSASGFLSRPYVLKVLPRPSLLRFGVRLDFPGYLHRPPETIDNTGDLQVPQGTRVTWTFLTRNTDALNIRFADTAVSPNASANGQFSYSRRFLRSNRYTLNPRNRQVLIAADSMTYGIDVIPDQFPTIAVEEKADSIDVRQLFFSGQVKDDYGFTGLSFHYKLFTTDSTGRAISTESVIPMHVDAAQVSQSFFHSFRAGGDGLLPGDRVEYYFEVRDNDGVNGPKAARSRMMTFKAPTREELSEKTDKNNAAIKKEMEESIRKARKLQKDINDLARKVNDNKQPGYEEKKKLEELLRDQKALQDKIEQIKQQNEANNMQQSDFSPMDETILEKQKQLEQLFENVMTPEMKKLFDELNRMLDKLDKNQVMEKLDEMKLSNKDIEKELDRNLEAFKELEVQQKMQEAIDRLDELRQKQDELKEKTEGRKEQPNGEKGDKQKDLPRHEKQEEAKDLARQQEDLAKQFDKLKEDLKELGEKNAALEEPNPMPDTKQQQEEISKEMDQSARELNQNDRKNSAGSQKSASDKMQELRDKMEQAMESAEEEQESENAQALRQILENLLQLSFSQEDLMKELSNTRIDNPRYVEIPKAQKKLMDDSRIIEDSLYALSKRAPQISALVNREVGAMNRNMDKTVKALAERNSGESAMRMQSTMKSANDLALLLNESLEQMQNQMKQQMQSKSKKSGKCRKPGKGSGMNPDSQGKPAQNLRKLQEQLNKQLQEMKEALEKGQKPGEKPGDKKGEKPGSKPGNGQQGQSLIPGSSEQFAKMAAMQEALRRQMQEIMDKLKNKGKNPGGDIADMMEQTEKDLVNKRLTNETMKRQQDILTRLLESEKAEREREEDQQRKSNEQKTEILSNPEGFLEYKRLKEREMELLQTVPPSFTPYYKEKVNHYFNNLNSR